MPQKPPTQFGFLLLHGVIIITIREKIKIGRPLPSYTVTADCTVRLNFISESANKIVLTRIPDDRRQYDGIGRMYICEYKAGLKVANIN